MKNHLQFDSNNPLYRFYEEVINQKKLHVLDEIYTDNYVNHIAPSHVSKDLVGLKKLISEQIQAFPDWKIQVDYVLKSDNKLIVKWTLIGTHLGDYFGIKPTGKSFKITGVDIETIQENKISEHDGAEDMLSLLEQIGAVSLFVPTEAAI